jgi:hypothetical protein
MPQLLVHLTYTHDDGAVLSAQAYADGADPASIGDAMCAIEDQVVLAHARMQARLQRRAATAP